VIHHLLTASEWASANGGVLRPASLSTEGFVHCSPDDITVLAVANAFYRHVAEPMLVLDLDHASLGDSVRWEPPAHPDGRPASPDEPRFPHLYSPIEPYMVVAVRHVVRSPDGTFTAVVD
jgi:uncharacterized protein